MWFRIAKCFIWLVAHTPFFILYGISTCTAFFLTLIPGVRKVPKRNFFRVYPEESERWLWRMTFKYIQSYIDFLFEFAKMTAFSPKKMRKHCQFHNVELLNRLAQEHTFILCFGGHMVNFEMLTSFPLHSDEIGMCHLYLAAPPSKGLDWVLKVRGKYGAINIPSNNPLKTLLKLKQELESGQSSYKGYLFGSLSDMDPKMDDKHSVRFLDHELEVKTGAEKLARKFNMGFCYAHLSRIKRGYYEVVFQELIPTTSPEQDEYAYTDEFVRQLEKNIREQPEIWMQWGANRF